MVLVFMFSASWRLTVVTFVMIPLVLVICKVGGAGGQCMGWGRIGVHATPMAAGVGSETRGWSLQ